MHVETLFVNLKSVSPYSVVRCSSKIKACSFNSYFINAKGFNNKLRYIFLLKRLIQTSFLSPVPIIVFKGIIGVLSISLLIY